MLGWVVAAVATAPALSALEPETPQEFRVRTRGGEVRFTWHALESGPARHIGIYEHQEPILDEDTLERARLIATVPEHVEEHSHFPDDTASLYYAAFLLDEELSPVPRFSVGDNVVDIGISVSETAPLSERATQVRGLVAKPNENSVRISFDTGNVERPVVIVRSREEITSPADALGAVEVARAAQHEQPVLDYPIPGIPGFYAAFDAAAFDAEEDELLVVHPGGNTTRTAVALPLEEPPAPDDQEEPAVGPSAVVEDTDPATIDDDRPRLALPDPEELAVRPSPLPTLRLYENTLSGAPIPGFHTGLRPERPLDQESAEALERLRERFEPIEPSHPELRKLEPEQDARATGRAATLRQVFTGSLQEERYDEAVELLTRLERVTDDADTLSRLAFYRGQAYYRLGNYEYALADFLVAGRRYRDPADEWARLTLDRLADQRASAR